MPVDTQHSQYVVYSPVWRTLRDTITGHRAVNARGEVYLPRLSGQDATDYEKYLKRTVFFNAVGRVSEAMVGMVFRKPPTVEGEPLGELVDDVTGSGQGLVSFAQDVFNEIVDVTRCGVMVDYTRNATGAPMTLAQAQTMGMRPYMAMYKAENIINWRVDVESGGDKLVLVVLAESREVASSDGFGTDVETQYRVLKLVEGVYVQEVWQASKGGGHALFETVTPMMAGRTMDYIPFRMFGTVDGNADIAPPLLEDLAYVNLAHYRNTADLEHGLHFTGLPTAVITGVKATDQTYSIGSANAWVFENDAAKATYLEFTGAGLGPLKEAIKDKEQQMAALGARMLAPDKLAAESADSIAQRRAGEISALAGLSKNVSRGLTKCMEWMRDWIPAQGDVSIVLNTEFNPRSIGAQEITALLQAVTTGQISSQSFYDAMVRGEVLNGERTYQEERELIAENGAGEADALTE